MSGRQGRGPARERGFRGLVGVRGQRGPGKLGRGSGHRFHVSAGCGRPQMQGSHRNKPELGVRLPGEQVGRGRAGELGRGSKSGLGQGGGGGRVKVVRN